MFIVFTMSTRNMVMIFVVVVVVVVVVVMVWTLASVDMVAVSNILFV